MKTLKKAGLAVAVLAASQFASAASLTNMGFESGKAPWTGTGSSEVSSLAYEGSRVGQIDGSENLTQSATLTAGTSYDFMWRFISTDTNPGLLGLRPDISYVAKTSGGLNLFTLSVAQMAGMATTLASSGTAAIDTGWQYFSWVPSTTYTGPITFGIASADSNFNSQLLLDSTVPLPGAALLFGSALFGAGALRRKQAASKAAGLATA
jgi:hypothetical protein